MRDYIDVAQTAAAGAVTNLRLALRDADPIIALLLLGLIKRAVRLQHETEALLSAVDAADDARGDGLE